jgi:hypothetical protein
MKTIQSTIFPLLVILTTGCLPISDRREISEADLHPPQLLSFSVPGNTTVEMEFSKPAALIEGTLQIVPGLAVASVDSAENKVIITFAEPQQLGTEYTLAISVEDSRGNSMDILAPFYGFNPNIPGLCINEFTTQGSGNHPDLVELFAFSAGNTAGVTLYEGTKTNWEHKLVLPPMEVEGGTYILLHCKPEGIPEEIDETESTDESGGLDASADAYDFWVPGGSGLSGNNGVIALYTSPEGELIDGVLYSNRTSASDEKYRGFGTRKVMERADELAEAGGWKYAGELIAPEDAIDPEDSTATRSMCRSSSSEDTDSKEDWHIVPTSTYTFGRVNSDEVYVP